MNIYAFITDYQELIGSFLAIFFSIGFWYLTGLIEKKRNLKQNIKEIENIFLMASRDSEEAYKNIEGYLIYVRKNIKEMEKTVNIILPPKFNKVYVNEERLFVLKNNLNFNISQQIDIAVSASKIFNGYLDNIEITPQFIFDSTLRLLECGIESKEDSIKSYGKNIRNNLEDMESLLKNGILTSQRHLLRPVVALNKNKKFWKSTPQEVMDNILDHDADLILTATKIDLAL